MPRKCVESGNLIPRKLCHGREILVSKKKKETKEMVGNSVILKGNFAPYSLEM